MPEWLFLGYLFVTMISLAVALFVTQRWSDPAEGAWSAGGFSVVATVLLMVPLFYLVYIGLWQGMETVAARRPSREE